MARVMRRQPPDEPGLSPTKRGEPVIGPTWAMPRCGTLSSPPAVAWLLSVVREPPIHWEEGMPASETGTARPGVSVGPTSEFSLFFHVTPGHGDALREALRTLQDHPGYRPGDYNMAVATIHEARFVLFDDDTRLLFATSFDGPWDAYMEDFFTSGPTLELFDALFQHVDGYEGLPDVAAVKAFVLSAQVMAAAYARNYGGTVKEIRKAERVNKAFQRVLDDPEAGEALQHPALQPLLAEAAD
jgi:hypothetical protein